MDDRPPRPALPSGYVTDLDEAYRRHYDPDYGEGRWDV